MINQRRSAKLEIRASHEFPVSIFEYGLSIPRIVGRSDSDFSLVTARSSPV